MTTVPQSGPSQTSTFIVESAPHIELTQRVIALAKNILDELEALLGEPSYVILAKFESWERSSDQEEWSKSVGTHVGMGGNPLRAIDPGQKKRLNVIDGVPLLVIAETFMDDSSRLGIIIDVDEKTNGLIQFMKEI